MYPQVGYSENEGDNYPTMFRIIRQKQQINLLHDLIIIN